MTFTMNKKVIIVTICIIGIFFILFIMRSKPKVQDVAPDLSTNSPYYEKLRKECRTRPDDRCCKASLKVMIDGNYKLANKENECPKDLNRNTLKCPGSYIWCQ